MGWICDNYLTIKGEKKNLEQLLTYFKTVDEVIYFDTSKFGNNFLKTIKDEANLNEFSFYTLEWRDDSVIVHFDTDNSYYTKPFVYLSKKLNLYINYSYCELSSNYMGNVVIENGLETDYPIDFGTVEWWREYYTHHAEFEADLKSMSQEEYLASYSKQLREALELDKEFY